MFSGYCAVDGLRRYADSEEVRNALESKSLGVQYYSTSEQTQSE